MNSTISVRSKIIEFSEETINPDVEISQLPDELKIRILDYLDPSESTRRHR